ncbi:hypothetical protein VIJ_000006 [Vibrio cholerae RC27]|nr:hypothetical protein VIJ_000006 [Vibrio cholerae RC27]
MPRVDKPYDVNLWFDHGIQSLFYFFLNAVVKSQHDIKAFFKFKIAHAA